MSVLVAILRYYWYNRNAIYTDILMFSEDNIAAVTGEQKGEIWDGF